MGRPRRPRAPTASRSGWTPRTFSISSIPRGTTRSPKASCTRPAATSRRCVDAPGRLRPQPDYRRLLVRGRRRLGHRPLVHRLRPSREPRHELITKALPIPDNGPLWSIIVKYGADDPLHAAHRVSGTFMKWGTVFPERHDLSVLARSRSVGEPINPEDTARSFTAASIMAGKSSPTRPTWPRIAPQRR